jgi:hypothetical protein
MKLGLMKFYSEDIPRVRLSYQENAFKFLGKNDPLKFFYILAKLVSMNYTEESLKYRANLFKYVGLALVGTPSTIIFWIVTDKTYLSERFSLIGSLIATLFFIFGIFLIIRGIDILEIYGKKE